MRHGAPAFDGEGMANVTLMADKGLDEHLAHLTGRLIEEYAEKVGANSVREAVDSARIDLRDATVTKYLPVLIERSARDRIKQLVSAA